MSKLKTAIFVYIKTRRYWWFSNFDTAHGEVVYTGNMETNNLFIILAYIHFLGGGCKKCLLSLRNLEIKWLPPLILDGVSISVSTMYKEVCQLYMVHDMLTHAC